MKIEVTNEELALVLDGLSQIPLARSFNLFTRLMREYQAAQAPSEPQHGNVDAPGQQP